MLQIKTNQGITKIITAGEPMDIACDCVITTINCIRRYAAIREIPEGKAAIEVSQELMKFFSGNWRDEE